MVEEGERRVEELEGAGVEIEIEIEVNWEVGGVKGLNG
jgi:hypothetical protein